MNTHVIAAIFRRNFLSYFANPTGYVFICVYVLLNAIAAFWPNEFFNANLANLDQLNRYAPYIMLVFIPAITMSIWADERRQGTDELLLTIPATDFEVVLGKYLAAVAIFSVSLLYSMLWNYGFLWWYGEPDLGLFIGNTCGYWLMGVAMLAIGMVASFLTNNLTVAFVLGVVLNAPLVFAPFADAILSPEWAPLVRQLSLAGQFYDFGRGVLTLSGVVYFLMIVTVMLYLCMVLIGRRHWAGKGEGSVLGWHFFARTLALVAAAAGLVATAINFHSPYTRLDITTEKLSSLDPDTRKLIAEIKPAYPVRIEAFISPEVPETFVTTRLDLLSTLRELEAMGRGKIEVHIFNTEPYSPAADRAEKEFGITSRQVASRSRGAIKVDDIYLGAALTSGLNKVVVPFFERGVRVEYELIRSVCTVAQEKRKVIGVLQTDARLFGGLNPQTFAIERSEPLIEELRKQYDVQQVSADGPISDEYDVLLAVQPSSLTPEQMKNFVDAVKRGIPTAVFEDPFPNFVQAPATSEPKRPPANPMFGGMTPPMAKGNIEDLWRVLGVEFTNRHIVWQDYNPYRKYQFPPELVFIDNKAPGAGLDTPLLNPDDPVSSALQQLCFPFPGAIAQRDSNDMPEDARLQFKPLVSTGTLTGKLAYDDMFEDSGFPLGGRRLNERRVHVQDLQPTYYVLAARITGRPSTENLPMADAEPEVDDAEDSPPAKDNGSQQGGDAKGASRQKKGTQGADGKRGASGGAAKDAAAQDEEEEDSAGQASGKRRQGVNVVLVSDIDLLSSVFFDLRAQGEDPERDVFFNFDNVTLVLNILDELAGDDRFINIRKRRPRHRVLVRIQKEIENASEEALKERKRFEDQFRDAEQKANEEYSKEIDRIRNRKNITEEQRASEMQLAERIGQRRLDVKIEQLRKRRDKELQRIERDLAMRIRANQSACKALAVLWPPWPLVLMGLGVFFHRRAREHEGVARTRLR